jgi:hypothetical protein
MKNPGDNQAKQPKAIFSDQEPAIKSNLEQLTGNCQTNQTHADTHSGKDQ